jgi:hypothetical protein
MKKKKYTAQITENNNSKVSYEIDGWGESAQAFHKTVLNEHIKFGKEDILYIFNDKGKRVFNINRGFSGN